MRVRKAKKQFIKTIKNPLEVAREIDYASANAINFPTFYEFICNSIQKSNNQNWDNATLYSKILDYIRKNTAYYSEFKEQTIIYPNRLKELGRANCVDATTFVSSILKNFNIPHYYSLVGYDPYKLEHIYVITNDGYVIDGVYNRSEKDRYNQSDVLNKEVNFYHQKTYFPKL